MLVKDFEKGYLSGGDMETTLLQFIFDVAFFSLSQVS